MRDRNHQPAALLAACAALFLLAPIAALGAITEIIDATGDGGGNTLSAPIGTAVDGSGNVYVAGFSSHNAFKITPGGLITEIIDSTGDGMGNTLSQAYGMAVDGADNVYVTGFNSANAFKITPGGVITEIIDATGDGMGNPLDHPWDGIAVDGSGNVYVAGDFSHNAFKITPGGVITEIIDSTGDGAGNTLTQPRNLTVDGSGDVYLTGFISHNAFKISSGGAITEIIDSTGDGIGNTLNQPNGIAVTALGDVLVAGFNSSNAFKIPTAQVPAQLSIAATIPAAELEAVDVDVDLSTNSNAIAATTFSVDYDETCLSFDDTDSDADNIPDALSFNLPAGFAVTAFHDLGDSDGEIDVSIADLASPIATLPDGALLTITFTSTCSPATDATIVAPTGFSSDPAATFSDDLAVDVDGSTSDGSVEIWPGPRGDCNRTGALSAADLIADALEIFDDDGTFWADVVGSTFLGSPVGCDANDDTAVDAGDISCTILLIFGGTCGGGARGGPDLAFDTRTSPVLVLENARRDEDGRLWIPVVFSAGDHAISSAAFSLDLANSGLAFDPFDGDGDGLPDSVRFPRNRPDLVDVRYNAADRRGELDVTLAEVDGVLGSGVLLEVGVQPLLSDAARAQQQLVRFSETPAASFGNLFGNAVPGQTVDSPGGK